MIMHPRRSQGPGRLPEWPHQPVAVLHYWLLWLKFEKSLLHLVTVGVSWLYNCTVKSIGTDCLHSHILHTPHSTPITVHLFSFITLIQAAASLPLFSVVSFVSRCLSVFFTPKSSLCFICIISLSWLNPGELSFGAAAGGRVSGSCNQYLRAMGPLWKSSGI